MDITITDDIYYEAERLLRLPAGQWGSHLRDMHRLLRGRMAEPEFVPEQHARAQALIVRVTAALRDGGDHRQGLDARNKGRPCGGPTPTNHSGHRNGAIA